MQNEFDVTLQSHKIFIHDDISSVSVKMSIDKKYNNIHSCRTS